MRLWTSRYQHRGLADRDDLVKVRTSRGAPRWRLAYPLAERCVAITPKREELRAPNWAELYVARLEGLGVDAIRRELEEISSRHGGRDLVLLCFEDVHHDGEGACHRRAFARWYSEKTGEVVEELARDRPPVLLLGGGPDAILAACRRAARRAGWSREEIAAFEAEATAGAYEHLLAVLMERFDADLNGSD
jgi:hypothetical protein